MGRSENQIHLTRVESGRLWLDGRALGPIRVLGEVGIDCRVVAEGIATHPDFAFRLTKEGKAGVVTNRDHLSRLRFAPVLPHAFTEHGAIMAASVLNSRRAVEESVADVSLEAIDDEIQVEATLVDLLGVAA